MELTRYFFITLFFGQNTRLNIDDFKISIENQHLSGISSL